jgi:hypothetical protein
MDSTPFLILLFFHLASLILGLGSVLVTDLYGLLWVWDRVRFRQVIRVSTVTEKFIWLGWLGLVATGVPLLMMIGEISNLTIVKLFFVTLVGVNGVVLHFLQQRVKVYKEGDDVPNIFMFRLILALNVSQLGWWGAVVIGFLNSQMEATIAWPDNPWLVIGAILAGILVVAASGEALMRAKKA